VTALLREEPAGQAVSHQGGWLGELSWNGRATTQAPRLVQSRISQTSARSQAWASRSQEVKVGGQDERVLFGPAGDTTAS
jgi:hypothetical protein